MIFPFSNDLSILVNLDLHFFKHVSCIHSKMPIQDDCSSMPGYESYTMYPFTIILHYKERPYSSCQFIDRAITLKRDGSIKYTIYSF